MASQQDHYFLAIKCMYQYSIAILMVLEGRLKKNYENRGANLAFPPFSKHPSFILSISSRKASFPRHWFPAPWNYTGGAASAGTSLLDEGPPILAVKLKQKNKYHMLMDACQERERKAFSVALQTQKSLQQICIFNGKVARILQLLHWWTSRFIS